MYEQYYLWVVPVLIILSYMKRDSGLSFLALVIGVTVAMPRFAVYVKGSESYYGIPVNLPADAAILSVLPSVIVAIGLISMLMPPRWSPILAGDAKVAAAAIPSLWFTFSLAYYGVYQTLFLGWVWPPLSLGTIAPSIILLQLGRHS